MNDSIYMIKKKQTSHCLLCIGTIVFSIHQPRHSIFKLFDTVLLLSHGLQIYLGPSSDVRSYLMSKGFNCLESGNPADFVLDVLIKAARNQQTTRLHEEYCNSQMYQKYRTDALDISSNPSVTIANQKPMRSIASEFYYLSQRTLRNAVRSPALLMWQITVSIILAVLTGLLYYRLPKTIGSGVQNRLGGIFFVVVNQIFSTATALEPFIKERALFIHVRIFSF